MKNLLALIGLVVVLVLGAGWYLGWYHLGSAGTDGHLTVDVDAKKAVVDIENGEQKLQKKAKEIINNNGTSGTPTPTPEKKVEGTPTGLIQFNPDGSQTITLPKIEVKSGQ